MRIIFGNVHIEVESAIKNTRRNMIVSVCFF